MEERVSFMRFFDACSSFTFTEISPQLHHARYKFDTPFEREIKAEVFKIVRRGREFGTPGFFFRAFLYIAFFGYMQYLFATSEFFTVVQFGAGLGVWKGVVIAVWFGIAQAWIGLNVQVSHGMVLKSCLRARLVFTTSI